MNEADLVRKLAARSGADRALADRFVTELFDTIARQLTFGGRVQLRGFGTFETKSPRDRQSRAVVEIEAPRDPHFTPGKTLRRRVEVPAEPG